MTSQQKQFRFSGRVAPQDTRHQVTKAAAADAVPDEHYLAPTTVMVKLIVPPDKGTIGVPQYSPTVYGGIAGAYNPAGDCKGNFMSYKFQPNNNCYAYGSNIATNTYPQPGRRSGYLITGDDYRQPFDALGELVSSYAGKDGLVFVGKTMAEVLQFKAGSQRLNGHFVALMVSPAGDANWPGDYHWARCDNSAGGCDSWSQKDGKDQVTNFDFAGNPITDPSTANWTVNQGPCEPSPRQPRPLRQGPDHVVEYGFYCFMFVPGSGVNII